MVAFASSAVASAKNRVATVPQGGASPAFARQATKTTIAKRRMATLSSLRAPRVKYRGPVNRSLPLVALALAVAVLVVEARIVVGGKTWDDVRYHTEVAPPRLAAASAVLRGEPPAWWDGPGLG